MFTNDTKGDQLAQGLGQYYELFIELYKTYLEFAQHMFYHPLSLMLSLPLHDYCIVQKHNLCALKYPLSFHT